MSVSSIFDHWWVKESSLVKSKQFNWFSARIIHINVWKYCCLSPALTIFFQTNFWDRVILFLWLISWPSYWRWVLMSLLSNSRNLKHSIPTNKYDVLTKPSNTSDKWRMYECSGDDILMEKWIFSSLDVCSLWCGIFWIIILLFLPITMRNEIDAFVIFGFNFCRILSLWVQDHAGTQGKL